MNKRPLIGVGAVVFNARGQILLIKRGKAPHYGRWMVPGGTLEWGETLEQAAIREVREETGIEIKIEAFVEFVEAIAPAEGGYHFLIMDYAAQAVSGSLRPASDALDAVWADREALPDYDLPPELVTVIEKAQAVLARIASD